MAENIYTWPPENDSPGVVFYLDVLPGRNYRATFVSEALWENALVIWHLTSVGWRQIDERGNYRRSTEDLDLPVDRDTPQRYAFVAWHKESRPDPRRPWHQSFRMRIQQDGHPNWEIGWRDASPPDPPDWRNIKVTIFHSAG